MPPFPKINYKKPSNSQDKLQKTNQPEIPKDPDTMVILNCKQHPAKHRPETQHPTNIVLKHNILQI